MADIVGLPLPVIGIRRTEALGASRQPCSRSCESTEDNFITINENIYVSR
jgi:hypothetical protein